MVIVFFYEIRFVIWKGNNYTPWIPENVVLTGTMGEWRLKLVENSLRRMRGMKENYCNIKCETRTKTPFSINIYTIVCVLHTFLKLKSHFAYHSASGFFIFSMFCLNFCFQNNCMNLTLSGSWKYIFELVEIFHKIDMLCML